jgi:hypothetical protein
MTDTPPEIEQMQRNEIMARSGEEHFVMGAQMFDAACEMISASLSPSLSETEQRRQLFKHVYGKDLDIG